MNSLFFLIYFMPNENNNPPVNQHQMKTKPRLSPVGLIDLLCFKFLIDADHVINGNCC